MPPAPTIPRVAPTQVVPAFHIQDGAVRGRGMRWGLVPAWSKEISTKFATFNARSETVAEKPTFRSAWKKSQTCIVPALGYYEWTGPKGSKQPYFIHNRDGEPLVMAGLWDRWDGVDEPLYSCTIITRPAEGPLKDLHPRMPVMVSRNQAEPWLEDGIHRFNLISKMQHPEQLEFHPVSKAVNRSGNEGEHLIERAD